MNCDLKKLYSKLANKVPTIPDGHNKYIFTQKVLQAPTQLTTDQICIKRLYHGYNSYYRVDQLWFFARKASYRYLGLLILSTIFQAKPLRVTVDLTHPYSEIKQLIIENNYQDITDLPGGFHQQPYCFVYYPKLPTKHPWLYYTLQPYDLPCFYLTDQEECPVTEEHWQNRDKLIGFGNNNGSVLLAELLLNISIPENELGEFHLECEAGYRGIGEMSAEASFYLPGHLAWSDDEWED